MILSGGRKGKRRGLVYNIYKSGSAIRFPSSALRPGLKDKRVLCRVGWYKLIVGAAGKPDGWIPPSSTHSDRPVPKTQHIQLYHLKRLHLEIFEHPELRARGGECYVNTPKKNLTLKNV